VKKHPADPKRREELPEQARLAALYSFDVLDTPPEADFDELAALAASICGTPMAGICLVDAGRLWFKASHGFKASAAPRAGSPCERAMGGNGVLQLNDAACNPPFYAGAALLCREGQALGTLFVADSTSRQLMPAQVQALQTLARQVMAQLELRRTQTRLQAAERVLRERNAVLQLAHRLVRLGSWRWDQKTLRSVWSEETCQMFGVDPAAQDVADIDFMTFVHPDDRTRVMQTHLDAVAGLCPYDVEYRAITATGEALTLHARAEIGPGPDGSALTMVGTLLDVTDRVTAEAELKRHRDDLERLVEARTFELIAARDAAETASRAKGDFLSSMSHELRTPMNAILGFSQLLELDRTLEPRAAGYVHEILRAGHHLLQLINEVLDLARIESGRMSLSPEPLPLAGVVAEAHKLVLPLAAQRSLTVTVADMQGLVVRADRLRLKQVLLNLLSNAVKYNRIGGRIDVEVQAGRPGGAGAVRITVRDTGIGIAQAHLPLLFQPFSRVGGHSAEGTGIGLSLCERLMRLMNGTIGVDSTTDVGSAFWIELPSAKLADPPPPLVRSRADAPPPRPARQARVLYVEDNPANQRLVEMIVQRHAGVELQLAPSGSLGLELARADPPDLLLLDIHLPDLDGYQVLAQLRADPATRALPVVAVTAQAMPADVRRVLAAGFDGYLAKPLELAQFDDMLDRLLQAPPNPAAD